MARVPGAMAKPTAELGEDGLIIKKKAQIMLYTKFDK